MNHLPLPDRYTNPVLAFDVPDPDVIALPEGGYGMVASSFDRRPGLPLWHSDDLVNWVPVGHVGGATETIGDGGVWAPSIRAHGGRLHVVWGDPDRGIFASGAERLAGPWEPARLITAGRGLIDPCPGWHSDGRAFIVHALARSRAGVANRLEVFDVDAGLTHRLSPSRLLIDGDAIPGCSVLEGPKIYRRGPQWWIFAPAGGVETGWQYAFRASRHAGPWEHRIVLAQGSTTVNGPHQGAWVAGRNGEEWFLHFQATRHLGRVLHLQPLRWGTDGWPLIGAAADGGEAEPVRSWPLPAGAQPPTGRAGDDFVSPILSPAWHGRGAEPDDLVAGHGGGTLTLRAVDDAVLAQPVDGTWRRWATTLLEATAAALVIDGDQRWLLEFDGTHAVVRCGRTIHAQVAAVAPLRLGASFDADRVQFLVADRPIGPSIRLTPRRWTGVEIGLQARSATARFGPVLITSHRSGDQPDTDAFSTDPREGSTHG